MKNLLFFLSIIITFNLAAQNDSINRYNARGKKDGYWKVYLDSMIFVTDSVNAYFYGYDFYDDGKVIQSYSHREGWRKRHRIVYSGPFPVKGKPVAIDGTFKYYDGTLMVNLEVYDNGYPVFWEAYNYKKDDTLKPSFIESFYFDKLYNNTPGTYYYVYTMNWADGSITRDEFWFREGDKGWKSYKIKEPKE